MIFMSWKVIDSLQKEVAVDAWAQQLQRQRQHEWHGKFFFSFQSAAATAFGIGFFFCCCEENVCVRIIEQIILCLGKIQRNFLLALLRDKTIT